MKSVCKYPLNKQELYNCKDKIIELCSEIYRQPRAMVEDYRTPSRPLRFLNNGNGALYTKHAYVLDMIAYVVIHIKMYNILHYHIVYLQLWNFCMVIWKYCNQCMQTSTHTLYDREFCMIYPIAHKGHSCLLLRTCHNHS